MRSVKLSDGSLMPLAKFMATGDYTTLPNGAIIENIIYLDRGGWKVKRKSKGAA